MSTILFNDFMKIAACAICKNEEKNIPRWLEYTADFDYRFVVDTGSADNSVRLLKDAGVFVVEKKFEPFRFDAARNSVFEFVPNDADWLAWPDFDEYYNKNWRNELERTVAMYPWITRVTYRTFQHIGGKMEEGTESGTVMESKIHKNGMYIWKKPVHEHLKWVGEEEGEAVKHVSSILRFHMHEPRAERQKVYFEISRRALDENPNDEYLIWFVLKEYYYIRKDLKKSKEYAERYLSLTRGNTDFRAIARRILIECGGESFEGRLASIMKDIGPSLPAGRRPSFTFLEKNYTFRQAHNVDVGRPSIETDSNFPHATMRKMILDLFKNKEDRAGAELARTYLKYMPSDIAIVNEFAGALYRQKKYKEALVIMDQLARQYPHDKGIMSNLAKCYQAIKRPDDASKLLKQLYEENPSSRDYALDYALYLSGEGKFTESEKILRSLASDPRVHFNLGWYEMRKGNFKKGFEFRDKGRQEHLWGSEHVTTLPKEKRYKGEPLVGKTVLLFCEGGLGDEMIFARFARVPKERGAKRVIMGCSPQLVKIFTRAFLGAAVDEVLPISEAKKRFYDYYVPMMNAPNLLDIENPNVTFPYLKPDPKRVVFWKEKMDTIAGGKPKIGIRWAGNPKFEHEQFRTVNPRHFLKLNTYGKLFSLQRDWGASLLPHNHDIYDLRHDLKDWDDTLAVLANLDLLVSSCTSIVHAAGAIDTPTCVIVPISPYFTWAIPETRSSWYPSVTIFRQEKLRSFKEPIQKIHEFVSKKFSSL